MHAMSVRAVTLAAVLACLPAAPALEAQNEHAGSAGAVRFGFQGNMFKGTRTLKLILSGAATRSTGHWSVSVGWKEKERQLDLDVVLRPDRSMHMARIGYCDADVSHVFPVGDSGVLARGEITATFRTGDRLLGAFRMTVTEREIEVEPIEQGKDDAVVSSRARRYVVVPRSGTVQMHIDPFQPKETVDRITGRMNERGYRELEPPAGTDLYVLSPAWVWHRGTVPTHTFHRRYFEPEEGRKLPTKEEWERLIPEGVAASIAAWP